MTRDEMIAMLKECCDSVHEGITPTKMQNTYPRIVYWDYVWEANASSGTAYTYMNTYQISVFSTKPPRQNSVILALRERLYAKGIFPMINHEYNEEDHVWHSYLAMEIAE